MQTHDCPPKKENITFNIIPHQPVKFKGQFVNKCLVLQIFL